MTSSDINHIVGGISVIIAGITAFLMLVNKMLKEAFALANLLKKKRSLGALSPVPRLKKL